MSDRPSLPPSLEHSIQCSVGSFAHATSKEQTRCVTNVYPIAEFDRTEPSPGLLDREKGVPECMIRQPIGWDGMAILTPRTFLSCVASDCLQADKM